MLSFFKVIPAKIWGWVLLLLSILGFIYTVYREGQKSKDVNNIRAAIKSARKSKEIVNEVDGISDDAIIERLRKNGWLR